jgi:hypothetical protein
LVVLSAHAVAWCLAAYHDLVQKRYHGNETAAVGVLRQIAAAEAELHGILATGTKQGYLFRVVPSGGDGFVATAAPTLPGETGERWFFVRQDRVVFESREPDGEPRPLGSTSAGVTSTIAVTLLGVPVLFVALAVRNKVR